MKWLLLLLGLFAASPALAQDTYSSLTSPIANGESRMTAMEALTSIQRVTPTAGQTVVADGSAFLIIAPAGTLATLTVTFPASPTNGQNFQIVTTQTITVMTLNGGTINGLITTISAALGARWKYSTPDAAWLRVS